MSVPDYQSLMLPVLLIVADGKEHRVGDPVDALSVDRSTDDREAMLPSGRQRVIVNRTQRWDSAHPVRRPDLQAFAGSLEGQRASKGVFITTSRFTANATEYIGRIARRIVLIDGATLARLMYDHGVAVRGHRSYEVKRVDDAYFEGEV